ncbi:MAG TPA: hypothetical protein VLE22_22255 [Bryobacteraceae bacterium]|nr:hypothetical protein [Bryobacteraceae bacterium]
MPAQTWLCHNPTMELQPETAPGAPSISEDGVDLTLIRWMLSLSPAERLEVLQQFVTSVERIRAENDAD